MDSCEYSSGRHVRHTARATLERSSRTCGLHRWQEVGRATVAPLKSLRAMGTAGRAATADPRGGCRRRAADTTLPWRCTVGRAPDQHHSRRKPRRSRLFNWPPYHLSRAERRLLARRSFCVASPRSLSSSSDMFSCSATRHIGKVMRVTN